ncbi:GCN5-related N-acetyltransferase [Hyalangium minutum]|uniref:GCN5-related N-acetyltransferase n=2 Tax=Hyalangium minutum TaxID=394096 RepID=A0A085WUN4_9BACT|nr:GCN5-related N-acetyltransferase [Hyalangium minutum]
MAPRTARFSLRKFTSGDVGLYHQLTGNVRVMQFVTGRPFTWEETAEKFERILARSAQHEHEGVYAIHDSGTDEFVGAAALLREPTGRVELGYRILDTHWGRGIATEVAAELLRFGLHVLHAPAVVAYVDAENTASIRVLEKIGMRRVATTSEGGCTEHEYLLG